MLFSLNHDMHFFAVLAWCTILLEYKWLIDTKVVPSRAKQFGPHDVFDVFVSIHHTIQHL